MRATWVYGMLSQVPLRISGIAQQDEEEMRMGQRAPAYEEPATAGIAVEARLQVRNTTDPTDPFSQQAESCADNNMVNMMLENVWKYSAASGAGTGSAAGNQQQYGNTQLVKGGLGLMNSAKNTQLFSFQFVCTAVNNNIIRISGGALGFPVL